MPYEVKEHEGQYCIFKPGEKKPGEGMCHPTKAKAEEHMAAMYANIKDAKSKSINYRKAVSDAPALRGKNEQSCMWCNYYKRLPTQNGNGMEMSMPMPEHGICELHDFITEGDWVCNDWEKWEPKENVLKAISKTDTELIVGNYIALFGGRDLTGIGNVNSTAKSFGDPALMRRNKDGSLGEFFTPQTDFESQYTFKGAIDVDWEHGGELGEDEILGYVDWKTKAIDEKGVFVKRVLNRRNQYVKWLEELIDQGLIGTSSNAVDNQVEKKATGEITKWALKRDTLTVAPFEPRMLTQNTLTAMKALKIALPSAEGTANPAQTQSNDNNQTNNLGGNGMDEKEIKALIEQEKKPLIDANTALADIVKKKDDEIKSLTTRLDVVEKALKAEPADGGRVRVNPEQKYPYKAFVKNTKGIIVDSTGYGEFLQDLMQAESGARSVSPRLGNWHEMNTKAMKAALGLNATTPSEGGFFVQTDHSQELVTMMIEEDDILARLRRIPLGPNADGITLNGVDETSRASTIWGGILAYWLSEAAAPTASKPKFREIKLEVKGLGALYYATDKVLKLAPALGSEVANGFREAMTFKVKDAVINGSGAGKPLGIYNSGSLVSVAKESNQTAATIVSDNISNMKKRLFPSSFRKAIWLANIDTQNMWDTLAFTIGAGGVLSPYVRYTDDGVLMVHGKPVIFSEHCQTLGTTGDVYLWDPSSYYFIDLGGIEEASSIHVAFTTFDQCFRFGYYCDGQPKLASALTPAHGSNTLTTHVKLDTRS